MYIRIETTLKIFGLYTVKRKRKQRSKSYRYTWIPTLILNFVYYNNTNVLHPSHYYVVDGNMDQLNEETNEAHHQKAKSGSAGNLSKLCVRKSQVQPR